MEQLNRNDLQELSILLKEINFNKQNSRITLTHILVRALFLLGERSDALTLAENESKKINLEKTLSKKTNSLFSKNTFNC